MRKNMSNNRPKKSFMIKSYWLRRYKVKNLDCILNSKELSISKNKNFKKFKKY